uniref:mediator of RNA polymerase II transcription subunit 23-like isoform X1 n=1 Tax=Ciona intestinalis TaxID=7719 RepID=UPI0005218539|nr:mediator of RNA polymerase II transcription subunit 23-like isoform X1 [Ciona intestinalis]|eukprot:XP_009858310.1 mediator of RNA polymerase II transcription subunit 23-like isoform X1 [Ciona intestinalis]
MSVESQLEAVFGKALNTDIIVEVFTGFVSLANLDHTKRLKTCIKDFRTLYNSQSTEEHVTSITLLIKFIHKQQHPRRISFMFDFLETCIQDGFLLPRPVLDQLQGAELVHTNRLHWCRTYEVIRKFVHMVDYKGCRNLLHSMVLKMTQIPQSVWIEEKQQVDAICSTIQLLLDPEACLLPGYLAVNEIRQNMQDDLLDAPWPLLGKLTEFIDRFRATATMVSTTARWMLLPVVDHAFYQLPSTWKLEADTLRFQLKKQLPYRPEMYQRQHRLLNYILDQTYSRDMVLQVLGMQKHQKQRCEALEMGLVDLMFSTVKKCSTFEDKSNIQHLMWQHVACQVIYFVLYQLASFPHIVEDLHTKLAASEELRDQCIQGGRDYIMWVLLQFISGSIQKNPLSDFLSVIKLVNLLYPEKQPLELPEMKSHSCTISFAAVCNLVHLNRKAQAKPPSDGNQDRNQQWNIPVALHNQHECIKQCLKTTSINLKDSQVALISNACSSNTEMFNMAVSVLVESVFGDTSSTSPMPGNNCVAFNKTVPCSMDLLDTLTVHTKMSMLHSISTKIQKFAQAKSSVGLAPALVETYSRLLIYYEIETLGIKILVSQVVPKVYEYRAWGILNTLLELMSYRMHHIQPNYRIQLLTHLHTLANSPHANQRQLHLRLESTALKLIMGFDNFGIKPQLVRMFNEQKQSIVSQKSEELNRVLVLTLARSIHITGAESISGSWCTDILKAVMSATPHRWPQQTLACFPQSIQDFFNHSNVEPLNKKQLKTNVEQEYIKWAPLLSADGMDSSSSSGSSLTEADALNHFSQPGTPPYYLCLLWKVLFEEKKLSSTSYKVLERIGASQLSQHVRKFSDFLVYEFSVLEGGSDVKICANVLQDMVWKYNIVFLDRLILCLALRSSEANDVQVAFFIIQYLLIKPDDFLNRVRSFDHDVENLDHWMQDDWHAKHMAYHQKFPEHYFFEGLVAHCSSPEQPNATGEKPQPTYLPTYFCNITLRFLPVLDIVIHRCLELPPSSKSLETLLEHLGLLYKFHDQPVTYLFNTLHYYESKLRGRHLLKKKLVSTIIGAITKNKPPGWILSETFMDYLQQPNDQQWQPDSVYYCQLIQRLANTVGGKMTSSFSSRDWRFNEFPNASSHALHVTCVEALALPLPGEQVGQALMDVVLKTQSFVEREQSLPWLNAVALVLTALPEIYWKPLHQNILKMLQCPTLTADIEPGSSYPYHILSYSNQQLSFTDMPCTRLLALTHVVWHHMSIGQLSLVSQFLKEEAKPLIETELQLLYIFHLIGPYFPRFQLERTRCMMDVAQLLYNILLRVSKHSSEIHFADEIADFLYHVKYMHIGVAINDRVEEVVVQLQPKLRKRLQFITQAPASSAARQQSAQVHSNTTTEKM